MKYKNNDGSVFSKEEFLQKLKTDREFNNEFGNKGIDQISELIRLLKETPDSRRMVVNVWAVHDLPNMVLPPCHYGFQVYTRELSWEERVKWVMKNTDVEWENLYIVEEIAKDTTPKRAISLMWNQRSVDTPLGLPFNIASYALLLELLAMEVNMIPDELIGNLGDCHIYLDQQDGVREQLTREPMPLGKLSINTEFWNLDGNVFDQHDIRPTDFHVLGYKSHPAIKFPLSN